MREGFVMDVVDVILHGANRIVRYLCMNGSCLINCRKSMWKSFLWQWVKHGYVLPIFFHLKEWVVRFRCRQVLFIYTINNHLQGRRRTHKRGRRLIQQMKIKLIQAFENHMDQNTCIGTHGDQIEQDNRH